MHHIWISLLSYSYGGHEVQIFLYSTKQLDSTCWNQRPKFLAVCTTEWLIPTLSKHFWTSKASSWACSAEVNQNDCSDSNWAGTFVKWWFVLFCQAERQATGLRLIIFMNVKYGRHDSFYFKTGGLLLSFEHIQRWRPSGGERRFFGLTARKRPSEDSSCHEVEAKSGKVSILFAILPNLCDTKFRRVVWLPTML